METIKLDYPQKIRTIIYSSYLGFIIGLGVSVLFHILNRNWFHLDLPEVFISLIIGGASCYLTYKQVYIFFSKIEWTLSDKYLYNSSVKIDLSNIQNFSQGLLYIESKKNDLVRKIYPEILNHYENFVILYLNNNQIIIFSFYMFNNGQQFKQILLNRISDRKLSTNNFYNKKIFNLSGPICQKIIDLS